MITKLIVFNIFILYAESEDITFVSKSRTPELEKYEYYYNAVILYLVVPRDSVFASFKFTAYEQQKSIFSCPYRDVSLHLKFGSPPFINPDNSKYPSEIKNITYSEIYNIEFSTNEKDVYINISSPDPGSYFAATFLSYTDPRDNPITQQGLSPSCYAIVESSLYVRKIKDIIIVNEDNEVDVLLSSTESRYFKFFVPNEFDVAVLLIEDISHPTLSVRYHVRRPPSNDSFKNEYAVNSANRTSILLEIEPDTWHYLEFQSNETDSAEPLRLKFKLKYFTNRLPGAKYLSQTISNITLYNVTVLPKTLVSKRSASLSRYNQYNLNRITGSESFIYSFDLDVTQDMLIPINVTNQHFTVLKFEIRDTTDVGGTLQYILAFKPRVHRENRRWKVEDEPENHTLVGCIQRNGISVPTYPNDCISNGISSNSKLVLNKTSTNSTILIPYPESGVWYASFRLMCGECEPCDCPNYCQEEYEQCLTECQLGCDEDCDNCVSNCTEILLTVDGCSKCDCDGPCRKSKTVCNSSVLFDISSTSCYYGSCGSNGKCTYIVTEGLVYSTCMCTNHYRGFACSDDSQATPFYLVVLELLLLVLSNLAFLPSTYFAYKRKYYVEALSYFAICFFSTFYHACDAGENIINFCLTSLNSLQFADFFCALLAIWLTTIAIADVTPGLATLLQMGGAIVLAFCTTINRRALWIFVIPSCSGILLVAVSWYMKYRKVKQRFANRRYLYVYLPSGVVLVVVGLLIYSFLQTESTYMYLHSLWHMLMAAAVIILLPRRDTFHPEVLL